jgi:hypothetical protein
LKYQHNEFLELRFHELRCHVLSFRLRVNKCTNDDNKDCEKSRACIIDHLLLATTFFAMISNVVKRGIVILFNRESIAFIKSQVCFDMKRSADFPNILPSADISRLTAIANVLNSLNITPGMDAIKDADLLGTDRMKDAVFVAKLDSAL